MILRLSQRWNSQLSSQFVQSQPVCAVTEKDRNSGADLEVLYRDTIEDVAMWESEIFVDVVDRYLRRFSTIVCMCAW